MSKEIEQIITHLKNLDEYDKQTFECKIKLNVSKTFNINFEMKEEVEKAEYIKRYLLNNYFPECFSLKVLEYSLGKSPVTFIYWLQCKVELNTEEYKSSVVKYTNHFLVNPKWRVAELYPMRFRWHE